jgi:2-deoxy-D-gluconate 3-dehydrogenase
MKDLFSVRDKVVVVTGGSRGIGEMIAAGFLANGAKVYISSRKAAACDATAERLAKEYGGICRSIPADLATLEGHRQLLRPLSGAGRPSRRAHQ